MGTCPQPINPHIPVYLSGRKKLTTKRPVYTVFDKKSEAVAMPTVGTATDSCCSWVRRVRLPREGGNPDPLKGSGLIRYLASILKHAQTTGRLTLDPAARELWWHT